MAIYYLDYAIGNDANDGSTWALAWKTLTLGATAARIAPGDIIRIAKSPDTTSLGITATWTNLSRTVTLGSALTANISLCEVAWTASANITATTSATRKEGTYSSSLAIAAGFTTGKIAYGAAVITDYSGYQQVSFWIRTSVAISAGVLTLRLCSDTIGDTTVNNIAVPAIPATDIWQVVTVDTGGALGASIQSIALYAESDPGTPIILIDNIIACKALSSADSLTLSSLISKNSLAQGGTEGFYGIKSINGTVVTLDDNVNSASGAGQGYSGATETVTTYKRETIKTTAIASAYTAVQEIMDSGTVGNNIQFQGGWDTGTTTQDGETYFDGQNGCGYGIYFSSISYTTLNYLNVCRYFNGVRYSSSNNNTITTLSNANNNTAYGVIYPSGSSNNTITTLSNANNNADTGVYYISASNNNTITTLSNANNNANNGVSYDTASNNNTITTLSNTNNNASIGVYYSASNNNIITTLSNANNNASIGVYYSASYNNIITTLSNTNNNGSYGVYYSASNNNIITTLSNTNNNGSYGVYYLGSYNNKILSLSTTGGSGIFNDKGVNYLNNALIQQATEVAGYTDFFNSRIYSSKHDQQAGYHKIFTDGGLIVSDTSVRHTASGISWKLSPTSTNRSSFYPLDLKIAKIAVNASTLVTVKAWMRRDNTGLTMSLVCRGGQLTGIPTDVVSSITAAINTWEEITITFTPTEAGVVEIEAWAYGGTTYNGYVDDMTITQS